MKKPILLGLHNPLSPRPDRALWPDPPGCSGHRLWQLSGLELPLWRVAYERMNLMDGITWDEEAAREKLSDVLAHMRRAPVTVILGHQVREFLGLPKVPWIFPQEDRRGFRWRLIPHPSGRTQTYNDPVFRAAVRLMLQELTTI